MPPPPRPPLPLPPAGLLDLQRAQEWVVTTKLGSSDKRPGTASASVPIPSCRLYLQELLWALFTWAAGFYALFTRATHLGLAVYLIIQGGWVGWEMPAAGLAREQQGVCGGMPVDIIV